MTSRRAALRALGVAFLAACDRLRGRRLVPVVEASRVTADSAYRATIAERPIIVVSDGRALRTFIAECTHEGCPLGWNSAQRLIRCPCHGSAFDTAGRVVQGPAQLPLSEIETVLEGGSVKIDERALGRRNSATP